MERSDDGRSLNRESETDLNMEIENVGANESVPGEFIEKAVDNVPRESGSSAGDLNVVPVDENIAPQPIIGSDQTGSTVNGDSYASRAARTAGTASSEKPTWRRPFKPISNDMPKRPRTALFTPSRSTSARSVFDALRMANINDFDIQCMQRKMNGEVVITFKSSALKEKFLNLNALMVGSQSYAVQDIDRPLTFLTIYDAPFELSDLAIIKRLAPFCEVVHYRRGKFDFMQNVYNGLRHYRVRITKPIPSFLRFGKYQIFLKHDGQLPTCRRCNLAGHFSNNCNFKVCFNCENIGHEAGSCPAPALCSFCKEDGHRSRDCRYSWDSPIVRGAPTDETANVDVDERSDGEVSDTSYKTLSDDSFRWANDSDLSDEEEVAINRVETLPLAAALSSSATESPISQPLLVADPPGTDPSIAEQSQPTTVSLPDAQPEQSIGTQASSAEPPATEPSVAEPDDADPSSVLFQSTAQLDQSFETQSSSADHSPDGMLDSQGLIKPQVVVVDDPPKPSDHSQATSSSADSKGNRRVSAPPSRISRRTPTVCPEALLAAASRKTTSPALISAKPRSSSSSPVPMDATSELKRKAQTQMDTLPKERREKKKKGKK